MCSKEEEGGGGVEEGEGGGRWRKEELPSTLHLRAKTKQIALKSVAKGNIHLFI